MNEHQLWVSAIASAKTLLSLWGPEVPEAAIRYAAALLQEQNADQFDFYAELVRALDSLRRAQSN